MQTYREMAIKNIFSVLTSRLKASKIAILNRKKMQPTLRICLLPKISLYKSVAQGLLLVTSSMFPILLAIGNSYAQKTPVLQSISAHYSQDVTQIWFDLTGKINYSLLPPEIKGKRSIRIRLSLVNWLSSSLITNVHKGDVAGISYRTPKHKDATNSTLEITLKLVQANQDISLTSVTDHLPRGVAQRLVLLIRPPLQPTKTPVPASKKHSIPAVTSPNKKQDAKHPLVIAIDPGHGGKDSGAIGSKGVYEKNIVLALSRRLAIKFNRTPGIKAILTRSQDRYLSLRKRLAIVHAKHADIFLSIHANAAKNKKARGASVYVLSTQGASSEQANFLAQRENTRLSIGGVILPHDNKTVSSILVDLTKNANLRLSKNLASTLLKSFGAMSRKNKYESAEFVVLKSLDIPTVLIEAGFLTNRKDRLLLQKKQYQNILVNRIFRGVMTFVHNYYPRKIAIEKTLK